MKRCNRCGAENRDEDKFCRSCGAVLDVSLPVKSSKGNLADRFNDANIFVKLIVIVAGLFILLFVSAWIAHLLFGFPLESYTDAEATIRQSEFNSLDVNGDGGLSYYEVQGYATDSAYSHSFDVFNQADKNDDGLLKGAEFDGYIYHLEKYYKDLEKQQKSEHDQASYSQSTSNPHFQDEGHESCPVCGSEDLSEIPAGWYCNDCGSTLDDDDLYLNYWEANGIKCILPSLEATA